MICRTTAALFFGALGLALVACSSEAVVVIPSNGTQADATNETADSEPGAPEAPVAKETPVAPASAADEREASSTRLKADPPPPVDVIGIQDELGIRWTGRVLHKDRMSWKAPDPFVDYFIVVIRELTPRHRELGLEVGKAYRFRGHSTYEYIRDVDLSMSDQDIARTFGTYQDKPIDILIEGIDADDADAVRRALAAGLSPDVRNRSERPVLLIAAKKGSLSSVRVLLEAGADVESVDVAGENALHKAARGGHLDVVRLVLEKGAAPDSQDHMGHTALFFAAEGNSPEVAEFLIGRGADVSQKDKRGYTPLVYAKVFLRSSMKPELRELLTPKD